MKAQWNNRQLLRLKIDSLTEAEATEVLDYITIMRSMNGEKGIQRLFDDTLLRLSHVVTETDARRQSSVPEKHPVKNS